MTDDVGSFYYSRSGGYTVDIVSGESPRVQQKVCPLSRGRKILVKILVPIITPTPFSVPLSSGPEIRSETVRDRHSGPRSVPRLRPFVVSLNLQPIFRLTHPRLRPISPPTRSPFYSSSSTRFCFQYTSLSSRGYQPI